MAHFILDGGAVYYLLERLGCRRCSAELVQTGYDEAPTNDDQNDDPQYDQNDYVDDQTHDDFNPVTAGIRRIVFRISFCQEIRQLRLS